MQEAVGSYFPWRLKKQLQNTPTHSNQQLVTSLEHFCTKFLCDCKKFDANFFLALIHRSKLNNIWCFMYTSSNIHRNLPASVVKNALQSVEYSSQAKMLNAALQKYTYNTPEHRRNTFLGLYLAQGYTIWQGLEHCLVSLGACVHAAFMMNMQSFCTTSTLLIIAYNS